jgi:SAM-dependent methyltransferase
MHHAKRQTTMKQPHDNWAKFYDFVYEKSFGNYYNSLTTENLKVINDILSNGTIIDFGAGTGRLTIPLKNQEYQIIAIEKSSGMIEELKKKSLMNNLKIPIFNCPISDYENGKADLALALFTVLSYSLTLDELSKNIKNISKHLKPNGHFFFDLPSMQFFNLKELPFIQTPECRRSVILKNVDEHIYSYKEKCNGIFNGEVFSYEDEFCIRYWEPNILDKLLIENGLKLVDKSFPQFNSTGSTYKLYKKI